MRLDRPGLPLFLQFKLCHQTIRRNCREVTQGSFNVPCYRMHLRSARSSGQHEMLLDLEQKGQEVYYVAPEFHLAEELNDAFLQRLVCERSNWIRPSEIGPLPDDGDHHVSFELGSRWTLFSEPGPIKAKRKFEDVAARLKSRLRERGRIEVAHQHLEGLADDIAEIADKRRDIPQRQKDFSKESVRPAAPLQRVAYYASVFLESQLFIVQERRKLTSACSRVELRHPVAPQLHPLAVALVLGSAGPAGALILAGLADRLARPAPRGVGFG